jgi:hypothetical protein
LHTFLSLTFQTHRRLSPGFRVASSFSHSTLLGRFVFIHPLQDVIFNTLWHGDMAQAKFVFGDVN